MNKRKKLVSILAGIMAAIMLLTMILGLLPRKASAISSSEIRQQINELKKEKEEIQDQLEELEKEYEATEDEITDIVAQKNLIDQQIGLLNAQLVVINEQIAAFSVLIADKQEELDTAQARYEGLNAEYKERIRTMEEDGSLSYWEVLFKASSFSDLLDRLNMVEEIAASDSRRLEELAEAAQNVEQAQEALELEKADLQETKQELDATQAELDEKRQEADKLLQELVAKIDELDELREEFEQEEADLLKEIAQKEKEYNDARTVEYWATYVPPTLATTAPTSPGGGPTTNSNPTTPSTGGGWIRPCSYVMLTSPFGYRTSPTSGASTYHQGVDLAGARGTPIVAARGGTVTISTYSSSAGYYVTINHGDGFSSIYMHMTHNVVSSGQMVAQGQVIGYMGDSGISTGVHLHFGIAYRGAYVNPCSYIPL